MVLFTFGDSWTEGVGGNLEEEFATDISEERTKIRHKYAWPTILSNLLDLGLQNDGVGAASNNAIFNSVIFKIKNGLITSDDFVIIMWSSPLRDSVPFFPSENPFHFWGNRYKKKEHLYDYLLDNNKVNHNINFIRAEKDFRNFYFDNLFTDDYYDIVSQNYIMYLQFIFKEMGIRYLFCDAFDFMIKSNIDTNIDKTYLIDCSNYWGIRDKTIRDFLVEFKRADVWEDYKIWTDTTMGKHPNKIGYNLIACELFDFIIQNELLTKKTLTKSYLI